ncbi:MAG: hypothetical protein K5891_06855 [Lachnospiraceae bacterium]|nr:hypothetical protein [Lachnospiraceae bacterium]
MELFSRSISAKSLLLLVLFLLGFSSCAGAPGPTINYGDAKSFEAALNRGEDLEGTIVRFEVTDFKPTSILGYNLWAGEHLNFVSDRNPGVKAGDIMTVKATEIRSSMGSWLISYTPVNNGRITEQTVISGDAGLNTGVSDASVNETEADPAASSATESNDSSIGAGYSASVTDQRSQAQKPEIIESGWILDSYSEYSGDVYINYYAILYNPNEDLVVEFPQINATIRNPNGTILGTDSTSAMRILPKDTVVLNGDMSVPKSELRDDTSSEIGGGWDNMSENVPSGAAKSSDFEIKNVSERSNGDSITGEVKNNSGTGQDMIELILILKKSGKAVYIDYDYMDSLYEGGTKAFEFSAYDGFPAHDKIEVYAQSWW